MKYRRSPLAEADLDSIWLHIALESGNVEIADRFLDSIVDRFLLLAAHPHVGRARDEDLRAGIRSFPIGDYLILYTIENAEVMILRVMHGKRDIPAQVG
ncbi:MAG TPA: type II toxin-antitoxin system RelE/ParE family toxin [Acidobacteriaceae bacterium]|nr:type II toxin-antitoxin system RelE/ParE family toxin [Acidobacteriaceae bacterium]